MLTRSQRPGVEVRRLTRHTWGPDPSRVVMVAVVHEGERRYARVIGAEGGVATELERAEAVRVTKMRPVTVRLADGAEWALTGVGCSCNVPSCLKGLNPLNVP